MPPVFLPDLRLDAKLEGPETGAALVLIHGHGLDLTIWDDLVRHLPHHRILRFDLRGHGQSDCPAPPYKIGNLIRDTERLIDHFTLRETVVLGHDLGGLIAQGLAVKRLDQVRGLILANSAAKIGHAGLWRDYSARVEASGLKTLSDLMMQRWLGRKWQEHPALPRLRALFESTPREGWLGAAAALTSGDFYETTATLRLPLLAIAGGNDGVTPADLMRETADLVPGHRFAVLPSTGHVPMIEAPAAFAQSVAEFLLHIGHI